MVHGIAIAPGKPTIIGKYDGKPVIGLPAPAKERCKTFIVLIAIVRHMITAMTGETGSTLQDHSARWAEYSLSQKYVRVAVRDGIAMPLFGKSGLLNTLVRSTGVIRVLAESEGLKPNSGSR